MPVILALRRLRQADYEFEASQGYIARSCLQKSQINKPKIIFKMLGDYSLGYLMLC
jgi:hypothetical protein